MVKIAGDQVTVIQRGRQFYCGRCGGRMFLEGVYADQRDYELQCIACMRSKVVGRSVIFGKTPMGKRTTVGATGHADAAG